MKNSYCAYYTGHLKKEKIWIVSSALRGTEHVAFDRALDVEQSIFEFFVPVDMEHIFLQVMEYLEQEGVLLTLTKEKNRLADGSF